MSANTTLTDTDLLGAYNHEKTVEYIPAIIFVLVVIVLGIFGNTFTIVFYGFKTKPTTTTRLIAVLATIDLATCLLLCDQIIDMCMTVTFYNMFGCKTMYFLNHWFVFSSQFMLVVIGIDRYRKTCRPHKWQFKFKTCILIVVVTILTAVALSVRDFVIIEVATVNITDVNGRTFLGYHCTHTSRHELYTLVSVSHFIDIAVIVTIILTVVLLYGLIRRTIISTKVAHESHSKIIRDRAKYNVAVTESDVIESEPTSDQELREQNTNMSTRRIHKKASHRSALEKRMSYMMAAITIGSLVSDIPYFIFVLYVKHFSETDGYEFTVWMQMLYRSFILNSAINPYIIGFFNTAFRQFVKKSICKCCW